MNFRKSDNQKKTLMDSTRQNLPVFRKNNSGRAIFAPLSLMPFSGRQDFSLPHDGQNASSLSDQHIFPLRLFKDCRHGSQSPSPASVIRPFRTAVLPKTLICGPLLSFEVRNPFPETYDTYAFRRLARSVQRQSCGYVICFIDSQPSRRMIHGTGYPPTGSGGRVNIWGPQAGLPISRPSPPSKGGCMK